MYSQNRALTTGMNTKKLRNDLILVSAIIVIALTVFLIFKLNLKMGTKVNIKVNNETLYSFSLSENNEKLISTKYGENTVLIKHGEVTVTDADCPDNICVKHRAISKTGETIVCLPHKLVVEIADEG